MEQPDLPHLSVCGCNLLSVANEMNWINREYSAGLKLRMPPCLFSFPAHLECLRKNTFLGVTWNASITENSNLRAGLFFGHYGAF